jgi:hypothetical protein
MKALDTTYIFLEKKYLSFLSSTENPMRVCQRVEA